jgi:hypothetical protein
VLSGHDFKGSDKSLLNQAISASQKLASRANLSLDATTQANGVISLQATVKPLTQPILKMWIFLS